MKKVAINGFGRIGRAYFRLANNDLDIEIVAINDLMELDTAAYLLQYDTTYGKFEENISINDGKLCVGNKNISFTSIKDPTELPWSKLDIDVVIESTGVFSSYEKANAHSLAGAKHVIITSPVKDDPPAGIEADTVLFGINEDRAKVCTITSNGSCTTNAVGVPLDVIDRELGIESAVLNTIHSYTATQQLVDGVTKKKSNLRFGRSGSSNIVPSSTGAAISVTKVLKGLENKFNGVALRVPTISGSIADVTFIAKRETTIEEVNKILKDNVSKLFKITEDPIVSSDIIGEPYISIADLSMTRVVNGNLVKVLFWYDNEAGYAQSLIERTKHI